MAASAGCGGRARVDSPEAQITLSLLDLSFNRTERTFLTLLFAGVGGFALLVALLWGSFRSYRHWQEGHLVRQAAAVLSGGDLKSASLIARRALQLNPDNVEAMRTIAEITEQAGDPSAVEWRRKVLLAQPGSRDDALALTRSALRASDLITAAKTLDALAGSAGDWAPFHAASGKLAELRQDAANAEAHWAKAVALDPQNQGYKFQLALVRLSSPEPGNRAEARRALEELRTDPKQRAAALRTLVIDRVARGEPAEEARVLAEELQALPEAIFSDRLLYLEILRQMQAAEFAGYFTRLKDEARAQPADLSALLLWMVRNGLAAEAIQFAGNISAETLGKWPVPMAVAEAHAQEKNWAQLERLTSAGSWGGFDFLRHAFLARALRGTEKELAAEQELAAAQKAAANPQALALLAQTVADWGWQEEAIEMLWTLSRAPEMQFQALQTLYQHYAKREDTPGLYRTLTKFAELRPEDRALANNLAQISMLLGVDLERARKVAADLVAKEPGNGGFVSTYAFGLLTRGDLKAALAAMNRLSDAQLQEPAVATYYGLILAAAGEKEKARAFLRRSDAAALLPEERALVRKAQAGLD